MNVTVTSLDIEVPRRDGGITLTSLRAFVAVVEEKSFSLAAQRLEVTQPGISLQLAALERACGFLVCHRKPQVALTEQGRALFLKARLIISQMSEFEASVRDLQDTAGGRGNRAAKARAHCHWREIHSSFTIHARSQDVKFETDSLTLTANCSPAAPRLTADYPFTGCSPLRVVSGSPH